MKHTKIFFKRKIGKKLIEWMFVNTCKSRKEWDISLLPTIYISWGEWHSFDTFIVCIQFLNISTWISIDFNK